MLSLSFASSLANALTFPLGYFEGISPYSPTSLHIGGTLSTGGGSFNIGEDYSLSISFNTFGYSERLWLNSFATSTPLHGSFNYDLQIGERHYSGSSIPDGPGIGSYDSGRSYSSCAWDPNVCFEYDPNKFHYFINTSTLTPPGTRVPAYETTTNIPIFINLRYFRSFDNPHNGLERISLALSDTQTDPFISVFSIENSVTSVPIPAAVWLFGSGLLALFGFSRKKKLK